MRCTYCMPAEGEKEHASPAEALGVDELARIVRVLVGAGIRRVRLTGGEPLVRKDVVEIAARIGAIEGVEELALSTNGVRLAELAPALHQAGVGSVNVSIDSIDSWNFSRITRGGELDRVRSGIDAALEVGMRVKTNTVVMRGTNEFETESIVDWAWKKGITPRFIERMPLGASGAEQDRSWVPAAEIIAQLRSRIDESASSIEPGGGPARYFRSRTEPAMRVGVISAISNQFCSTCNRVRLTSRGELRSCLASPSGAPLGALMRGGADDETLLAATFLELAGKHEGHRFEDSRQGAHRAVAMSAIGG